MPKISELLESDPKIELCGDEIYEVDFGNSMNLYIYFPSELVLDENVQDYIKEAAIQTPEDIQEILSANKGENLRAKSLMACTSMCIGMIRGDKDYYRPTFKKMLVNYVITCEAWFSKGVVPRKTLNVANNYPTATIGKQTGCGSWEEVYAIINGENKTERTKGPTVKADSKKIANLNIRMDGITDRLSILEKQLAPYKDIKASSEDIKRYEITVNALSENLDRAVARFRLLDRELSFLLKELKGKIDDSK